METLIQTIQRVFVEDLHNMTQEQRVSFAHTIKRLKAQELMALHFDGIEDFMNSPE